MQSPENKGKTSSIKARTLKMSTENTKVKIKEIRSIQDSKYKKTPSQSKSIETPNPFPLEENSSIQAGNYQQRLKTKVYNLGDR